MKFLLEKYPVLGGKAHILKTTQSGSIYQFRMWIAGEKRYKKQSLGTDNLVQAHQIAEARTLEILANVQSGKKVFGTTLGHLVEQYLEWRMDDVSGGVIVADRHSAMRSQLKHFLQFLGAATKVSDVSESDCFDYANWRRKMSANVRDKTIQNEQTTINSVMKFAFRKKYCHFNKFEFRKLRVNTDDEDQSRRDTFSAEEYDKLVRYMKTWSSAKACGSDEGLRLRRLLVRDCILIASNTMLRVGELWQLRWKDIQQFELVTLPDGQKHTLVTLRVRSETSKVRRSRTITTRGGMYFQRLKERYPQSKSDDYVFPGDDPRVRFPRREYYSSWSELLDGIGIDREKQNITWYSLRHFGITLRLKAGANVFDIAKVAGTSVYHIEKTYGHFDQEMARAVAMKNFSVSKEGMLIQD